MAGTVKAVFMDRDGTLNLEKNYVYRQEDFEWIPGVFDALHLLGAHGYTLIVVSNQSGVARGYYTMNEVEKLEAYIRRELTAQGLHIEAFYYCPHHPEGIVETYRTVCDCRKPAIGLFHRAVQDFQINPAQSWMIGDAESDIGFGQNAGLKTILVRTGHGRETEKKINGSLLKPTGIVDDLLEAAQKIVHSQLP